MLAEQEGERLTVGEIVAVLKDRAFALLIVILGLPNCLPMPPPIPLVCGLLLLLVAIQITAGMASPGCPARCCAGPSPAATSSGPPTGPCRCCADSSTGRVHA